MLLHYFYTINRNWILNSRNLHAHDVSVFCSTGLLSFLAGALMVVMIKLLDFIGFGSLDPYLGSANQDDLSRVLFF